MESWLRQAGMPQEYFEPDPKIGSAANAEKAMVARIMCTAPETMAPMLLDKDWLLLATDPAHPFLITEETRRLLTQIRDRYRRGLEVISGFSAEPIPVSVSDAWTMAAVQHARQLADQFVDVAAIEVVGHDDRQRAMQRVFTATPPSRRGKDSLADCVITEVALRLADARLTADARTVFFSSNTQEYCEGGKLKAMLQTEFDVRGLEYVRTWGQARRAILGRATRSSGHPTTRDAKPGGAC